MVKKGIILGNVISVDKANTNLIANLTPHTYMKDVRSFLRHAGFNNWFIKNFSKIANTLSNFLVEDVLFHFFGKCLEVFTKLKEALTITSVLHPTIWRKPF